MQQCLLGYLAGPARQAEALYILGDLFDVWIGDDGSMPVHGPVLEALAELTGSGMAVHFMRGNRDFAVGKDFAQRTGLHIMPDPARIMLYGQPTLLAHGDVFCSDDRQHQAFRAKYTDPRWRRHRLALPLWLRRAAARRARHRSRESKQHKPWHIMDANADTVIQMARTWQVTRIIHGHTHRPADHEDGALTRHVLADWRPDQAQVLIAEDDGTIQRRDLNRQGGFM